TVEADDTLTGANYHAIERGEPATGSKSEVEPAPLAQDDFATIFDEPTTIGEELEEESETRLEDEVTAEDDERADNREAIGPNEEGEGGRRRRRRRRRRGGDRSFGESIAPDAPQPTDDGLAVVAEIGGDLSAPISDVDSFDRKGARSEGERGGRRSRRSRGGRSRFSPRANDESLGEAAASGQTETIGLES